MRLLNGLQKQGNLIFAICKNPIYLSLSICLFIEISRNDTNAFSKQRLRNAEKL